MTAGWWHDLRLIVELETGMDLTGTRADRLRDAVVNVMRRDSSIELPVDCNHPVHARFVEAIAAELTVGESFFLRNENHMALLRTHVIPQIIRDNHDRREIRAWSAGCAAGEESYSLAILLDEHLATSPHWQTSILGTDLNPMFLSRAREGWYRQWSFRQTKIQENSRYFTPDRDGYRVQDHLRAKVRYQYLNLVKDVYPSPLNGTLGMDLILFRNVAIYLRNDVTLAILERLYQALRPGGWLLLGETEVTMAPALEFEVHRFDHATFHRKPLSARIDPASSVNVPGPVSVPVQDQGWLSARPPISTFLIQNPPIVPKNPEWTPLPVASPATPAESEAPVSGIFPPRAMTSDQVLLRKTFDPLVRSQIRFRMVQRMLEAGQAADARSELEICLKENPLSVEAHLLQAGLAEDHGNLKQAEECYRRVLYLDRECAMAQFHLGLVLQQQGNERDGLRALKIARKLAQKHDPRELVEYSDGVCYGRIEEMILVLTGEFDE